MLFDLVPAIVALRLTIELKFHIQINGVAMTITLTNNQATQ